MSISDKSQKFNRIPRRIAVILDQALISGANFVAFLVFARQNTPDAWGQFGFAYALVLFLQGFQRAAVTVPMITHSAESTAEQLGMSSWPRLNLGLIVLGTFSLAALLIFSSFTTLDWLVVSSAMAMVLIGPLFLQEFVRRRAILADRFDFLVIMAASYAAVMLLGVWVCSNRAAGSWLPGIVVALAAASTVALFELNYRGEVFNIPTFWSISPNYRRFVGWAALGHVAFSGYNFGLQALLGLLAGPSALGVFHACRAFIQPVATLIGAMDSIDKPRAARALSLAGPAALRRVLFRALTILSLLGVPYLIALIWFRQDLLYLAYEQKYADQSSVVILWSLVAMAMILAQPMESGLYVLHRTRAMFFSRVVAGAISILIAFPLVSAYGVAGALIAMFVGYIMTALGGAFSMRKS